MFHERDASVAEQTTESASKSDVSTAEATESSQRQDTTPTDGQEIIEIPFAGPWPFIPRWIRASLPALKGVRLSVLVDFISRADKNGISWPSLGEQARSTGYGVVSVKRARSSLVSTGLVRAYWMRDAKRRFKRRCFQLGWFGSRGTQTVATDAVATARHHRRYSNEGTPAKV